MPKFTIAIPTFNRSYIVERAIRSVLDQTYQDFELLIVDDASIDNTKDIIKRYHDPRIRYVRNECNLGIIKNINKCINLAAGEYYFHLADDDRMLPTMLEKVANVIVNHPEVYCICVNYYTEDGEPRILTEKNALYKRFEYAEKCIRDWRKTYCFVSHVETLRKYNLRYKSETAIVDYFFILEHNTISDVYVIAEPLHCQLRTPASFSRNLPFSYSLPYYNAMANLCAQHIELQHLIPLIRNQLSHFLNHLISLLDDKNEQEIISRCRQCLADPIWQFNSDEVPNRFTLNLFSALISVPGFLECSNLKPNNLSEIQQMCQRWVNIVNKTGVGISQVLPKHNCYKVAIFGSQLLAQCLLLDARRQKIEVLAILDNNIKKQEELVCNIKIYGADWLKTHDVDAVILSIENNVGLDTVRKQLNDIDSANFKVFSWKDLVVLSELETQ